MTCTGKLLGILLLFLLASCSATSLVTKKDAAPSEATAKSLRDGGHVKPAVLCDVPPEAELCSASPATCTDLSPSEKVEVRTKIAEIFGGKRNPRVPDLAFPVACGILSSPFGYRRGVFHSGLDIAASKGEPVRACADGRVVLTGTRKWYRQYGQTVLIDHGRDVFTHYAHLSRILVKKGDKIRKGQTVALVGSTGRATSSHLHLEVKVGPQFFNPYVHFAAEEVRNVEVAKGFNLTPMGPVRINRASAIR
jgi:murein DD-endopeptidase MepM/ murein hydrolase activator NlpD